MTSFADRALGRGRRTADIYDLALVGTAPALPAPCGSAKTTDINGGRGTDPLPRPVTLDAGRLTSSVSAHHDRASAGRSFPEHAGALDTKAELLYPGQP